MATNFPTSLDALTNPTSTNTLDAPSHSLQHANLNDAVEALEAKVGVNSSAVATSHDKILTLKANIASPTFTGTVTAPTFIGALTGTATNVTTNANLTGDVTSVGNAATIGTSKVVTAKIADGAVTGVKVSKSVSNFTGPTYTVDASDWILNHTTASDVTVTLPNAATYIGRSLQFRNTVPNVIVSATNNIVALTSAGTPRQVFGVNLILTATDGAWCELVSDGTYWLIVNASELT